MLISHCGFIDLNAETDPIVETTYGFVLDYNSYR